MYIHISYTYTYAYTYTQKKNRSATTPSQQEACRSDTSSTPRVNAYARWFVAFLFSCFIFSFFFNNTVMDTAWTPLPGDSLHFYFLLSFFLFFQQHGDGTASTPRAKTPMPGLVFWIKFFIVFAFGTKMMDTWAIRWWTHSQPWGRTPLPKKKCIVFF